MAYMRAWYKVRGEVIREQIKRALCAVPREFPYPGMPPYPLQKFSSANPSQIQNLFFEVIWWTQPEVSSSEGTKSSFYNFN